jgi:hypothetical protein
LLIRLVGYLLAVFTVRISLLGLLALLAALSGCGEPGPAAGDAGTPAALELVSVPVVPERIDLGEKGPSRGDIYVFDADLHEQGGDAVVGHIYGTHTSFGITDGREILQLQLAFDLGEGDSILVGGLSQYTTKGDAVLPTGETYNRAIIGGTGQYAGAGGTLTATRQDDGSVLNEFDFAE